MTHIDNREILGPTIDRNIKLPVFNVVVVSVHLNIKRTTFEKKGKRKLDRYEDLVLKLINE